MNTLIHFIFNRKNLIMYYFGGLLLLDYFLSFIIPSGAYTIIRYYGFRFSLFIWTALILGSDLIQKRFYFKDYALIICIWCLGGLIGILNPSIFNFSLLQNLVVFMMFSYIFGTSLHVYSKEEWMKFVIQIMKFVYFYILLILILSIILYFTNITIPLPFGNEPLIPSQLNDGMRVDGRIRYYGLFNYALPASLKCTLIMALGFSLCEKKEIPMWFHLITLIPCGWMIYQTESRTPLGIIAFMVLYYIFVLLRKKLGSKKAVLLIASVLLVGVIAVLLLKWSSIVNIYEELQVDAFKVLNRFTSRRYKAWVACMEEFRKYPIFGVGFGNNDAAYTVNEPFANCIVVNILLYSGILGMGCFIGYLILLLIRVIKKDEKIISDSNRWFVVIVVCLLLESIFEQSIVGEFAHIETGFFWLLSGYLLYRYK